MSSVFGGSKQKSESGNLALGDIKGYANPMMNYGLQGAGGMMKLLGGDASGFNAYKDATGFDWQSEQGSRGITNNAAAGGLLRSGTTGKALVNFGNNIQNTFAKDYLSSLLGVANLGNQAAGTLAGAGQYNKSSSKSKNGMGGFLGQAAAGIAASDRRLKRDIRSLYKMSNGLTLYSYKYVNEDSKRHIGVMADEVAKVKPEALGPVINGYATVNYSLIW